MITLPPNPPSTNEFPNWARKLATIVNELVRKLGAFGTSSTVSSSPYTATDSDYLLLVDASAGPITVFLQPNRFGKQLVIKRVDGSANVVGIDPAPGETIDGSAFVSIPAQWQSFTLMGVTGGWVIL